MSTNQPNSSCVFCGIVAKSIPSHTVFENERFLAFLSIDPISAGHTLIIPKEHYRWVWDVPQIGEYFEVCAHIARAQQKAYGIEAIHSKVVGEEVHHAHIWIFPDPHQSNKSDAKNLAAHAEKIRTALTEI